MVVEKVFLTVSLMVGNLVVHSVVDLVSTMGCLTELKLVVKKEITTVV